MKRAVLYSVVLLVFSTLLVQCVATQQDVEYTNVKVRKMDTKVEDINKEIEELKKQTVQDVQTRQAETGDRLDYQQSEILRLQGEIEETNFFIRQVQEENSELKKLLLARLDTSEQNRTAEINRLNERLALTEEQLLKALERVTFAETEITAIKEARSQEAAQRALEAAQRGLPVAFGPHMENFREIAAILTDKGGGFRITDEGELFELLRSWLAAPAMCREQGEKAQAAMQPHQGAVDRNLEVIHSILGTRKA